MVVSPAYRRDFANIGLGGCAWQLGRLGSRNVAVVQLREETHDICSHAIVSV